MNDDGIVGMAQRPGRQLMEAPELSKDDLLDWLGRQGDLKVEPPAAPRSTPKLDRAKKAALAIWGSEGPPQTLTNKLICIAINEQFRKIGEGNDVAPTTILRAVGRK
jgi:hypothetical protein